MRSAVEITVHKQTEHFPDEWPNAEPSSGQRLRVIKLFPLKSLGSLLSSLATLPRVALRADQACAIVLSMGLLARFLRYLACYPLWGDEAFVAVNVFSRTAWGLRMPLAYEQVAPYGFLLSVWACVQALGASEYALRLTPFLCGMATLPIFAWGARCVLKPWPLVIAVGMMAASHYPIRHASECKQYAGDLLAATIIFAATLRWRKSQGKVSAIYILGLSGAAGMVMSLPAVFSAVSSLAALSLYGGYHLLYTQSGAGERQREGILPSNGKRELLQVVALGAIYLAVVLTLYFGHWKQAMAAAKNDTTLHSYWKQGFPPTEKGGLAVLYWLTETHTGLAFAHPQGGRNFGSLGTAAAFAVGLLLIARNRDYFLSTLVLLPFLLGLIAAWGHLYPYGGSIRLVLYLTPGICLAAGMGIHRMLIALAGLFRSLKWYRSAPLRTLRGLACAALCGLCGMEILSSVYQPYKEKWDQREREISKWVWQELSLDAELVCLHTDLHVDLEPDLWKMGHSAVYLSNQKIYFDRIRRGESPQWNRVSRSRPLRVIAWTAKADHPPEALNAWLESMQKDYEFIGRRRFPLNLYTKFPVMLDVFEFFPKGDSAIPPELATVSGGHTVSGGQLSLHKSTGTP